MLMMGNRLEDEERFYFVLLNAMDIYFYCIVVQARNHCFLGSVMWGNGGKDIDHS